MDAAVADTCSSAPNTRGMPSNNLQPDACLVVAPQQQQGTLLELLSNLV